VSYSQKMAESEQRGSCNTTTSKEIMVKQEKRETTLTNGGKGSGDDADSLEELPLDIGEHYLVRRSDDSWRA
jgi:histone acetyltransferase MYST1